jgi:DNA modification methylase
MAKKQSQSGSAGALQAPPSRWRNRIIGTGVEDPAQLLANPKNWRLHPQEQQDALRGALDKIGWVQNVVVNKRTGFVVDGHLRVSMAISAGEKVPVLYVDLSEAEEALILATLDPVAGMAAVNSQKLDELLAEINAGGLGELGTGLDGLLKTLDHDCQQQLAAATGTVAGEDAVPPMPAAPVTRSGDLWLCGKHRVLCGDATSPENVARLLGDRKPILMVTDPPYGIELDSEWRDRAGLNGCGPAEASYMKHRAEGHTETAISGDTRADWSEAFELVPSLQIAYVWHASVFTREVLNGLLRIGFLYPQQIIWNKGRTVLTRTHYWYQHEPCWYVRKKNAPWFGKAGENSTVWDSPSPKFIMGASDEEKYDHPTQKPTALFRRPLLNHLRRGGLIYDPFLGSGTSVAAAELTDRVCCGMELDPKYVDVIVQRWQDLSGKQARLDGHGATFEHTREGRLLEAQDALKEDALEAEKPAAAGAGRARMEALDATG